MERDRYGYEIANCIKERTNDTFAIKEATLYSIVNRLADHGMITSYMGEKTHGKPRRYYAITTLGKAYFIEKKQEWIELKHVVDTLLEDEA
jgi:DNA-binding PadR family transcriptional regulator